MRHPSSEEFHRLLTELGDLHDRKQKDYGTADDPFANVRAAEDFGLPAWCGVVLRNNDKQVRLRKAVRDTLRFGFPDLANEGVEDSLQDMAVYAIIALVLFREWSSQQEAWKVEDVRFKVNDGFKSPGLSFSNITVDECCGEGSIYTSRCNDCPRGSSKPFAGPGYCPEDDGA